MRNAVIKVVRGNPTPEELAAALAVLGLAQAQERPGPARPSFAGAWNARWRLLGAPSGFGPAGWRASALPR
ncbi:acyl-CoA carboxylase subunit epsilon [Streptomyces thermoviolaceus]|uniref:acyl-CoA carboxylase epsilon subunit n=1 Tax=Streptomyces thermoviolaceus TaxID=1952 RepID=UPI00386C7BB0|nr:acyl-CoA carboxylase subunit epsilon [Streptomyces thermoviolaceus]